MTEPSSAGNPDGAALPADHPLGPAVPVPPREKEARHAGQATHDGGTAGGGPAGEAPGDGAHDDAPVASGSDGSAESADDGRPDADRREHVLDPSAGSAGHHAAGIRDEQGTHEAGAVPAAYDGDGAPGPEHRHPEDAAAEPDAWDSGEAPD